MINPAVLTTSARSLGRWLGLALLAASLWATVSGCGGCRPDPIRGESDRTKLQKELEAKKNAKPDFEPPQLTILPSSPNQYTETGETGEDGERPKVIAKPGHWVHLWHRLKANNADVAGDLSAWCVDSGLREIDLENSPYHVVASRPAALPKGQTKYLEIPLFVSSPSPTGGKIIQIRSRLEAKVGGGEVLQDIQPTIGLKQHQYFVVVLARQRERYAYLKTMATVQPPFDDWDATGLMVDYVVTAPDVTQRLPLPTSALAWTSIAYVVWDDVDPDALLLDQQRALIDWLHWGGQLIISGPKSLELLTSSFLAGFLPATSGQTLAANAERLAGLNEYWSLAPKGSRGRPRELNLRVLPDQPLEVVELVKADQAAFVPTTGELVVERRVGRGRIVATAFALTDPRVVNWQSFDGFLNGCLFHRPARNFQLGPNGFATQSWLDYPLLNRDALLTCGLRFFSRDAAYPGEGLAAFGTAPSTSRARRGVAGAPSRRRATADETAAPLSGRRGLAAAAGPTEGWDFSGPNSVGDVGYRSRTLSGIAGWNDFSSAANAARRSLQVAAGINVPDSTFVVRVLAAYLICLVPVNWLVFRLLGRVEWAWFAAPLIAIVGAAAVTQLAHVDIGFVRARTEIALVELQPDYPRAHVTRYSGLYSSLATRYRALFENDQAVALPFSTNPSPDRLRLQRRQRVDLRQQKAISLGGFPVISNSTGMLHVEQFTDLPGVVQWRETTLSAPRVANLTPWPLYSAAVLKQTESGMQIACLGKLDVGAESTVVFAAPGDGQALATMWDQEPATAADPPKEEVSLRELCRLATNGQQLQPGDVRFVAWTDQPVEGMTVRPRSNQRTLRTLIVAHLKYGPFATPQRDRNLLSDLRRFLPEDF